MYPICLSLSGTVSELREVGLCIELTTRFDVSGLNYLHFLSQISQFPSAGGYDGKTYRDYRMGFRHELPH